MLSALILIAKAADPRLDGGLGVTFLLVRFLLQRLDPCLQRVFGLLGPRLVLLQRLLQPLAQTITLRL